MIEIGTIVELSNKKKYIITSSTIENFKTYYLALEVDYNTKEPKEESMFFEDAEDSLIPIKSERDIEYLKTIFVDKFIEENVKNSEETV